MPSQREPCRVFDLYASDIAPDERQAAEAALAVCRATLGTPGSVEVVFFRPTTAFEDALIRRGRAPFTTIDAAPNIAGFVRAMATNLVFIRAGLGPRIVAATVVHECRHVWQLLTWGPLRGPIAEEEDANQWTAQVLSAMYPARKDVTL